MTSLKDPAALIDLDVRPSLDRVEQLLRMTVASDQPLVHEAALHLISAGGKRFRPMLAVLASYTGDPEDQRVVACAAAIELTHLATLYHDDVIDATSVRRGVPTVNAVYGDPIAVLSGDFLFARAASLAADLGSYVTKRLADTIATVCEGVIIEAGWMGRRDVPADGYLDVIRRKTASLIATSCHLGGWIAGAPPETVAALTVFGEALGMAFQLADDILDIAGYEAESGKTPGTDLRAGVLTLPALRTLDGTVEGASELTAALDAEDIDAALAILRTNGALELARSAVGGWQDRAVRALEGIPAGPGRESLAQMVAFTGSRTA